MLSIKCVIKIGSRVSLDAIKPMAHRECFDFAFAHLLLRTVAWWGSSQAFPFELIFLFHSKTDHKGRSLNGTPRGIRTPDLLVRSQTLYPAELAVRGAKPILP